MPNSQNQNNTEQKPWGGRFSEKQAEILEKFNASLPFDKNLYAQDIRGSIAHAKMLAKCGILSKAECDEICAGLDIIKKEIANGNFEWKISDEDIHMAIESRLIKIIGEPAKRLHTARSRNDQVALDFRLWILEANTKIRAELVELLKTLLEIAKNHCESLVPGMTHLQHAQPVNLGFLLCAHSCSFLRDFERLCSSYKRANFCPLGAAALAGVPYPIDRHMVANELGFAAPSLNATDSVAERDFALDFLYDCASVLLHISRIAEEMVIWSSSEFGWLSLSDAYSTGSSIMPQKKNPDVPELLRGKSGRVFGNLFSLLTTMKGLPLAYNKDTQEDKEGAFDSFLNTEICLQILREALKSATFNTERMQKACEKGHLSATDLADFLVQNCKMPFREAHHATGHAVAFAEKKGLDLSELSAEDLQSADSRIPKEAINALGLLDSMKARKSYGGAATTSTQIQSIEAALNLGEVELNQALSRFKKLYE